MNKKEFLLALKESLRGLPTSDIEERVSFYAEMIDDRMEEGISEADAIAAIGSVEDLSTEIIASTSLTRIAKVKLKPQGRLSTHEILLLTIGSPLWVSLAIAAGSALLAIYLSFWSVLISFWASFAALAGCAVGGLMGGGIFFVLGENYTAAIATIGACLVCAGLAILAFFGCKALTRLFLHLTKKTILCVKKRLIKKEETK